jgi:hypothetical protein
MVIEPTFIPLCASKTLSFQETFLFFETKKKLGLKCGKYAHLKMRGITGLNKYCDNHCCVP